MSLVASSDGTLAPSGLVALADGPQLTVAPLYNKTNSEACIAPKPMLSAPFVCVITHLRYLYVRGTSTECVTPLLTKDVL